MIYYTCVFLSFCNDFMKFLNAPLYSEYTPSQNTIHIHVFLKNLIPFLPQLQLITLVYQQIYKDQSSGPNKNMWMASCGAIASAVCLVAFVAYSTVMGSAFLLHSLLYYGCVSLAVAGVGLCVAGVVYFDKDPGAFQQGFEQKGE